MVYRLIDSVRRIRVGLALVQACRLRSCKRSWSGKGQGTQGKGGQEPTHGDDVVYHGWIKSPNVSAQGLNSATSDGPRLGWTLYVTACKEPAQKITPAPRMTPCVLQCKQSPAGVHGQRLHQAGMPGFQRACSADHQLGGDGMNRIKVPDLPVGVQRGGMPAGTGLPCPDSQFQWVMRRNFRARPSGNPSSKRVIKARDPCHPFRPCLNRFNGEYRDWEAHCIARRSYLRRRNAVKPDDRLAEIPACSNGRSISMTRLLSDAHESVFGKSSNNIGTPSPMSLHGLHCDPGVIPTSRFNRCRQSSMSS